MIVTYNLVNEIFKTLPIGFYLGRNIECTLSATDHGSYYNMKKDSIVISYPMIEQAIKHVDLTNKEIESVIRGLLYHEISHVILTPRDMDVTNARNIVEDERIETVNKNVFLNTNFKNNIYLINNYHGEPAKTADQAFYHLVRFHVDSSKDNCWITRLVGLLSRYKNLTANSKSRGYAYDIDRFYRDFIKDWNKNKEAEESTKSESDSSSTDTEESNSSSENTSDINDETTEETHETDSENGEPEDDKEIEDDTVVNGPSSNDSEDIAEEPKDSTDDNIDDTTEANKFEDKFSEIFDSVAKTKDDFINSAHAIIDRYNDPVLKNRLSEIIDRKLKQNKSNGSAINSYSGRLNIKSVTRDDYKWWIQQNREGHIRRFSNVHFNLFIDNSGSFRRNDDNMNTFIKALDYVQKRNSNFTFDVITINTEIREWKDHDNVFESEGGNRLTDEIKDVIKRHTKAQVNNYNIVLFDGNAHLDDEFIYNKNKNMEPFRHFNTNNTIIISDMHNKRYIDGSVTKARVTYTAKYCDEFIDCICNLLEKVI